MRTLTVIATSLLCACAPAIPAVKLAASPPLPAADLPALAPCSIVHASREQPLALAYDGGEGTWPQVFATIVIRHPSGLVVIDPAFGRDIARALGRAPPWFRLVMGEADDLVPLGAALRAAGLAPEDVTLALVTHVHWDHVGGLRDLPRAKIRLADAELRFARDLHGTVDRGTFPFVLAPVFGRLAGFAFDGPPVLGFAASKDLLGDGSILAVPLPGHTPGSAGYLVRSKDGRSWLFVGDAAWVREGIEKPAAKSAAAALIVDGDGSAAAATLGLLHAFRQAHPDVHVVVSHDLRTLEHVPACKAR